MPQRSIAYAVARIRSLETHLLDAAKFARLKEADEDEARKLLQEAGYGAGNATGDIEDAIAHELSAAYRAVRDVTPDPELTGLFLLGIDAHNLKALLKARLLGVSAADILLEGGLFPLEMLQKAVADKNYRELGEDIAAGLGAMEKYIANAPDPRLLSAAVDRAVFGHIQSVARRKNDRFVTAYFAAQADFLNVRSVVRARALDYDADKLSSLLVSGGEISSADLLEGLSLPAEQLSKKLAKGANGRAIAAALDEYACTGSAGALERRMDGALITLAKSVKRDTFSIGPVIGYLLGREAEAKALRVLFAAKRAGREAVLPELYA